MNDVVKYTGNQVLYNLLPKIFRRRDNDKESNQTLLALMTILESIYQDLLHDNQTLYDNWFIETCIQEAIPFIAEQIAVPGLDESTCFPGSWRALVANTIGYRRRKGTAAALANALRDGTGWKITVQEGCPLTIATPYVDNPQPGGGKTVNINDLKAMNNLGTPFDATAHTLDIRGIQGLPISGRQFYGKYNTNTITVNLWRLCSYPIYAGKPKNIDISKETENCRAYTFNPFGKNIPLFNPPVPQTDNTSQAGPENLPLWLTRERLREFLNKDKQLNGMSRALGIFIKKFETPSHEPFTEIKAGMIKVCNLENWFPEGFLKHYPSLPPDRIQALVDPESGRFVLAGANECDKVRVNYSYGFSGDLGGGPYSRDSFDGRSQDVLSESEPFIAYVSYRFRTIKKRKNHYHSISMALQAWKAKGQKGTVIILDNSTYPFKTDNLTLCGRQWLVIKAADGMRPCLENDINLYGGKNTQVSLEGLWIDGSISLSGNLQFTLKHCTITPDHDIQGIKTDEKKTIQTCPGEDTAIPNLRINISHCITGRVTLSGNTLELRVTDSIIQSTKTLEPALKVVEADYPPEPVIYLERSTILGEVELFRLNGASDCFFSDLINVKDLSRGYLRFCCLPKDSAGTTPPNYKCYELSTSCNKGTSDHVPTPCFNDNLFTSINYGEPGYAQLGRQCPQQVLTGAENGCEMGAFNRLFSARREKAMELTMAEFLPCGQMVEVNVET